jgi:hypothetical protein
MKKGSYNSFIRNIYEYPVIKTKPFKKYIDSVDLKRLKQELNLEASQELTRKRLRSKNLLKHGKICSKSFVNGDDSYFNFVQNENKRYARKKCNSISEVQNSHAVFKCVEATAIIDNLQEVVDSIEHSKKRNKDGGLWYDKEGKFDYFLAPGSCHSVK